MVGPYRTIRYTIAQKGECDIPKDLPAEWAKYRAECKRLDARRRRVLLLTRLRTLGFLYSLYVFHQLQTGSLGRIFPIGLQATVSQTILYTLFGSLTSAGPALIACLRASVWVESHWGARLIAELGKQYYTYARYLVVGIPVLWLLWHDLVDWWTAPWPDRWGTNLGKAMEQFEHEYAHYQAQLQHSSGKSGVKPAASRRANSASQRRRNLKAFDSLIGVDEAVEAIKDALELPILSPNIVSKYKIKPAKGVLLYGPPGTGKTSLARATAAYFGCAFDYINANDFMISLVGDSERALREKFEWARQNRPSVLFFDEFDSIGRRRDGMHLNRPSDLTINVLLAEMDGFESNDGVFVIAATNTVELLDPALVRPGRFDRQIRIPLPDEKARKGLFELYLKRAGRPLAGAIDFAEPAAKTGGLSPAAIAQICEDAARRAARRELGGGGAGIRMSDLVVSPTKAGTIAEAGASSQTPVADKVGGGL